MELAQRVLRALVMEAAVTEEVELPGPYAELALVNAEIHDDSVVPEFSFVRYDEQPGEAPVGVRGLVCPTAAAVNKEITARDVNMMDED